MSITYTIDQERNLIRTTTSGALTSEETIEYFTRLKSDPKCPEGAIEVVDFSAVTDFIFSYSDARVITQNYIDLKCQKHLVATVFFCLTEVAYGIARMLQILHGMSKPTHEVHIARSQEELDAIVDDISLNKTIDGQH